MIGLTAQPACRPPETEEHPTQREPSVTDGGSGGSTGRQHEALRHSVPSCSIHMGILHAIDGGRRVVTARPSC